MLTNEVKGSKQTLTINNAIDHLMSTVYFYSETNVYK